MRARGIAAFVDLGSGAGFPGIPLAIAMPGRALLVDSVGKKTAFLETAVAALRLGDIEVVTARSEDLAFQPRHREQWPALLARAVAGLGELVELAFPLLTRDGWLIAWKRGDIRAEVAQAKRAIDALDGGIIEVVDNAPAYLPGHRLVFVRKTGRTPSGWPRSRPVRLRSPL
jgi:16S rRNA (guanine527-N7)-methyltransferase